MTEEQYERSVQIKGRITSIEVLLEFLKRLSDNPEGANAIKASLTEVGFIAHPKSTVIFQADIDCWRDALDSEKARLEHEFKRL